jgi:hypothetical protein
MNKLSNKPFVEMNSNKLALSPIQRIRVSSTTEIDAEIPLNDLEVKSFFLLVGITMALST